MRFIMLKELIRLEPGRSVEASMVFPRDADVFTDHFPGMPLVPGTLITEAMGQAAGWLIAATLEFHRWPLLTVIRSAKFRAPVHPGDEIHLDASVRSAVGDDFDVQASARVEGRRVADAQLAFHVFEAASLTGDADVLTAWAHSTFSALNGDAALGGRATRSGAWHV
jgi:3-hydroxymyristoyl/3-hydroxydecanoyl-(acyl carrier protein) dehydratase